SSKVTSMAKANKPQESAHLFYNIRIIRTLRDVLVYDSNVILISLHEAPDAAAKDHRRLFPSRDPLDLLAVKFKPTVTFRHSWKWRNFDLFFIGVWWFIPGIIGEGKKVIEGINF